MHLIDQQLNLMIRGRFDEAWALSEKLEQQDPTNLRHQFNRGWFLLNQGKFQEGSQLLESGRFLSVYGDPRPPTNKPIWNRQDLTGKRLIISLEGGLGDQIIHARFAKTVQDLGGECIICCSPPLVSIMQRVPGVSQVITINRMQETEHDYWLPGFSCAWVLGYDYDTIPTYPYISALPASVEIWKNLMQTDKIKVGIRWSGNPKFEHQQFRIFPPEKLINLKKYKQIQFYSLQRDHDVMELPEDIVDLQHLLISWEDTAAAIQNLDLVVTSCTSIAHVSSAMGKPTWVIVPILPYHTWAYGKDHSPWYQETTRVFRQSEFSNWDNTFSKLEDELVRHFNLKS